MQLNIILKKLDEERDIIELFSFYYIQNQY